jgi:hypothetical protein
MIQQYLFAYPANFGKLNIYKCDYFGNQLSKVRPCFVDNFSVNVEQQNVEDTILFGSFNQTNTFSFKNRKINIKTSFMFFFDESGNIGPAIDLLMNLSAWSYQGTQAACKITGTTVISYIGMATQVSITYNQTQLVNTISSSYSLANFQWYAVNNNYSIPLSFVSVNGITSVLSFTTQQYPSGSFWVEAFYYNNFALYQEPQFRIDSSEGSFYPCMIDKITFDLNDEFTKIDCDIVAINYDNSTKYSFINASAVTNVFPPVRLSPNFLIKLKDYKNDISNNFLINDIKSVDYMAALITQKFQYAPVKKLSISIDNSLVPIYNNAYTNLRKTYVAGYYSKVKKISGDMSVYSLRSAQPTFSRYPTLSGIQTSNSLSVYFGNQVLTFPYTVWSYNNLEEQQGDEFVTVNFKWNALTNTRQGQPLFGVST